VVTLERADDRTLGLQVSLRLLERMAARREAGL
jgi:hypothetical protein